MRQSLRRLSVLPWVVWGIPALYFCFDGLQQTSTGVIGPPLVDDYGADASVLGTLSAFYFYSYAVMQIPVGVISDHFGPRRPLVVAALVAAGGSILFALSWSLASAEISRMVIGAGAAFSYVACLKIVSNWFPASRFATVAGLTGLVGMTGAIVGAAPLAEVVDHLGWRGTFVVFAVVAGAVAVLLWLVVRDHPPGAVRWEDHPERSRGREKTWQDIKHVLGKRQCWMSGIYVTTMNIAFAAFGATWGTSFIGKAYHISEVDAAGVVSMIFVGGVIGGPFWGWLSDRILHRRLPMILSAAGALVIMVVILYAPGVPVLPLSFVYVLLMLQGFFCSGFVLGYALSHDVRPPGSAGVSVGFVNTCGAGGTALFLPIIGWLSSIRDPIQARHGVHALLVRDFRFALTFIIVSLCVATFVALLSRETRCQSLYDKD